MKIRLSQEVTVIYEVTYTREEAIELLVLACAEKESLTTMTEKELADVIAATANGEDPDAIYEKLTGDAGDWVDTADVGDWYGSVAR